ncbi:MAG: NYN domain-containing protein [Firmicutes bacterium]|nr:NYN domain-containing protein [Bacillota bacterium]
MKRLTVGILAHVDSGKTTLSEGLLYRAGSIRRLGRVDHKDAFLDTNSIERERGITIFSKQAVLNVGDSEITLLDTPGHVDFSAETERTLQVLDYAILVISGSDKVQSHTKTLWQLLELHNIPTFIFVNKMDLDGCEKEDILDDLKRRLSDACVDFAAADAAENIAVNGERAMDEFLKNESVSDKTIADMIARRRIFPCFFGSALKLDGVDEFLTALDRYSAESKRKSEFGAKVFKISEDNGKRLTHMKICGGTLKVRGALQYCGVEEKVSEIRVYSGEKYTSIQEAQSGQICAVAGLTKTYAGLGIGSEKSSAAPVLEPVFSYRVKLPADVNAHTALSYFRQLEEEETQLHIVWNEYLQSISAELMGEVQSEVLKSIIHERFGMDVEFEEGAVIYKETIAAAVEGVGHYEPLRHYAEVHLLMEPGKRGSGLVFKSDCSDEALDRAHQRLVLAHLAEKQHIGVLTGSPITDMVITLVNGRASLKHTEGGDFRQATYRAVRQGLMRAESVLLEPYYGFTLELPTANIGRAMTDIEKMGGVFSAPEIIDAETSELKGRAPIAKMNGYARAVTEYTRGAGRLTLAFDGYDECAEPEAVMESLHYDADSDLDNTADSVFCSHGAGYGVKWYDVESHMHLPPYNFGGDEDTEPIAAPERKRAEVSEEELLKIFESVYGKVQRKSPEPLKTQREKPVKYKKAKPRPTGKKYLLVDGYNIIFADDELRKRAQVSLEAARNELTEILKTYRVMRQVEVIVVFDAYKVKGNRGELEVQNGVNIVYTKEAETADAYIERATHELAKNHRVRVATSDGAEQMIILGSGALRISADEFWAEVAENEKEIQRLINEYKKS